jgi:glycosyltransferase involved in cell wall biosynthesis
LTASPARAQVRWTFITPSLRRPAGGLVAAFEIANALAAGSEADVRIVHVPTPEARASTLDDLAWFQFEEAVEHHFVRELSPDAFPSGDVVVFTPMLLAIALAPDSAAGAGQVVDLLKEPDGRLGVPILFLQGLNVFSPDVEDAAVGMPGAKVCVGTWLADHLVRRGISPGRVHHIPNGVNHRTFRVTRPIPSRPAQVAMNYDPHPVKGGQSGIKALGALHKTLGTASIAFGTRPPVQPVHPGTTFVLSPDQATIAQGIYNTSSVYLQPSLHEGFGLCAVEAMASGCALVTTDNGGSADYAHDGETALVCGPDPEDMTEALVRVASDDDLRIRIAESGSHFVERFRWEASAERFDRVADDVLGR